MSRLGIAFDSSARFTDAAGRLHITRSHISKATVNPYYGREIPGAEALGLDPNKVYQMLRDPAELAAGASTFERLPILRKHIPVSAETPHANLIIGAIGSDVLFNDPYLDADISFWDAEAIAGIETNTVRELSAAYYYVPVMTPGEFQGQPYDGVMTQIRGNHLALVESGRAGSDVLAADEAIKTMKTTKLGKALLVTLGGMSPKLAQDSALSALVGQAQAKTFDKAAVSAKLVAMDSELDSAKMSSVIDATIALDSLLDPVKTDSSNTPATLGKDEDETEEEKKKRVAQDAEEEDEEEEEKKRKVAQDAAIKTAVDGVKADLREANEARIAVRPVVGDVIAQDSAEGIYGFALDHMKVAREGVTGVPALKALFSLAHSKSAAPVTIAQDSAGLATRFPNAARFRQA